MNSISVLDLENEWSMSGMTGSSGSPDSPLGQETPTPGTSKTSGTKTPGKTLKTRQRSRNGCNSCKKLRIKCNEMVPKCEYCTSTNRECVYYHNSARKFLEKPNNRYTNKLIKSLSGSSNISQFEMKILRHFKIYTLQFTSFINGPMHYLTTVDIPNLFATSSIVRLAVFSFGCLNSWVICDLPNAIPTKSMIFKNQLRNPFTFLDSIQRSLFDIKSEFLEDIRGNSNYQMGWVMRASHHKSFLNSITTLYSVTNFYLIQLVDSLNEELEQGELPPERGKALVVGVLMVLLSLALHSHNTTPFIKFDSVQQVKGKCLDLNSDILTIASAIRSKTDYVFSSLGDSEVATILTMRVVKDTKNFSLITILEKESDGEVFRKNLHYLRSGFLRCYELDSPIGLFKVLTRFTDEFIDSARRKDFSALRFLYIYSFVMLELRTCLFIDRNVWLDYIHWYKGFNQVVYGKWKEELDGRLFELIGKLEVKSTVELLDMDFEYIH